MSPNFDRLLKVELVKEVKENGFQIHIHGKGLLCVTSPCVSAQKLPVFLALKRPKEELFVCHQDKMRDDDTNSSKDWTFLLQECGERSLSAFFTPFGVIR